jgi:hypothetical protein
MDELTETPAGVQTAEHTSTKECRGPYLFSGQKKERSDAVGRLTFENPSIVLNVDHAGESETVESPADVPVVDLSK